MAIQEKIWGIVDAKGKFLDSAATRSIARELKKYYNDVEYHEFFGPMDFTPPTQIVQYKRWKKAS